MAAARARSQAGVESTEADLFTNNFGQRIHLDCASPPRRRLPCLVLLVLLVPFLSHCLVVLLPLF